MDGGHKVGGEQAGAFVRHPVPDAAQSVDHILFLRTHLHCACHGVGLGASGIDIHIIFDRLYYYEIKMIMSNDIK
jgi:hypothetical protein